MVDVCLTALVTQRRQVVQFLGRHLRPGHVVQLGNSGLPGPGLPGRHIVQLRDTGQLGPARRHPGHLVAPEVSPATNCFCTVR
ncbi:hypothetical protein Pma05_71590 [Plantactinospora mayteni]|uniref:Uncharacterized protein n=1 Tax=Plantactinospora mayteni TaxID=566021 RepID=A0ABQ4F126_9ACTN|nr:hypothetical protein Pma05_71590 [Plantactinospora mayteni]